jgi:CubicO group peptidase (beta-lactamase class C family)
MKMLAWILLCAPLVGVTTSFARDLPTATPESVGMSTERLARMDRFIHQYVDAGRTPGVVTLVMRHGKIVHVDAYGKADSKSGRPTRADDLFRLYSMTKPITAVALLMLYEEGKFQLNDPLAKYFPAVADMKVYVGTSRDGGLLLESQKRPMTIQDVFRHSAGFSYGSSTSENPVERQYADANLFSTGLDDLMSKLPKLPLLYQPGDRFVYSPSLDVLAALVEKLSAERFDEFVRTRIFVPLGMTDAYFKVPDSARRRWPTLYSPGPDHQLTVAHGGSADGYGDTVFGGHSVSMSIQDYAKFAQMLLNKGELNGVRLLSPTTVELMTSNQLPPTAAGTFPGSGYGLGVGVEVDRAAHANLASVGTFGWGGAAATDWLNDPKEDLVLIYCTQLLNGDSFALWGEFETLVYQAIVRD